MAAMRNPRVALFLGLCSEDETAAATEVRHPWP